MRNIQHPTRPPLCIPYTMHDWPCKGRLRTYVLGVNPMGDAGVPFVFYKPSVKTNAVNNYRRANATIVVVVSA